MKSEEPTNIPGLYKDLSSGAIVNKDLSSLTAYKKKKEMFRKIQALEDRVDTLEKLIQKFIGEHNS